MIVITAGMMRFGKCENRSVRPFTSAMTKNAARKPNQMIGKTRL